jgi:hypothetical protein
MSNRPFTDPEGRDVSLRTVVEMFADLGERMRSSDHKTTFEAIAHIAVERVPVAEAASITTLRNGRFQTVASTDERATMGDSIQYELGSGPCVDAILDKTLYRPVDLRVDDRWPEYGARVHKELGWTSMLSYRLGSDLTEDDGVAGLNMYSSQVHGFDEESVDVGLLLATHSALAIAVDVHRERANNLERALDSSREIGVAIGVLMARHQMSREQAFDALRIASQNQNRKLRDIAIDVAETGLLSFGSN